MKKLLFVTTLSMIAAACGRLDNGSSLKGVDAAEPPDFERDGIALAIPDTDRAEFSMPLESTGLVGGLSIAIRITHTYIGDLVVTLLDPTGAAVTLHNREGGSTQNIDKIYGSGGAAINQDAVMLHEVNGTWKLRIDDQAGDDVGTLDYVKLTILKV